MIGSAVEYAAKQHLAAIERDGVADAREPRPENVDFKRMLLNTEDNEEESSSLASVLDTLRRQWPSATLFQAGDVVTRIFRISGYGINFSEDQTEAAAGFKAALELACGKTIPIVSAPAINWKLQAIKDTPAVIDGHTFVLRYVKPNRDGRGGEFKVETMPKNDRNA